jgi:hypothetical protein
MLIEPLQLVAESLRGFLEISFVADHMDLGSYVLSCNVSEPYVDLLLWVKKIAKFGCLFKR